MEAHKHFRVEFLENDQAWELFRSKVGEDTLNNHPDILESAKIVVKECGGLPLITIGRAMAFKKTPEEWRYAIEVLKRSASEFPGMNEVYPRLKFTYDSLPNDKVRSCFLYCSLFSEDFKVLKGDLIDCWIEASGVHDSVKMHDVIRDMALLIACEVEKEKENFLVHVGARLTEAPKADKWIGLPSGISKLVSLQHLDLSLTELEELPKELKALVNLKCLNLDRAHYLRTIPLSEDSIMFGGNEFLIEDLLRLEVLNVLSIDLHCEDLEEVKIDIICKVQEIREPHGFQNLRKLLEEEQVTRQHKYPLKSHLQARKPK
ncbi:hypothetical protein Pint_30047 [Pistacia integerrima]|uniref:Uncharacterized protein n=1 Tax=Pistacia integerrima TaxID=434235 RepID=A0ACC0WZP5_9ROSI|nr:hypothetical protein Pint_30047 [Pistacia integerrima]